MAGEVSGGMHEDAASRNRVARDKSYTYSDWGTVYMEVRDPR